MHNTGTRILVAANAPFSYLRLSHVWFGFAYRAQILSSLTGVKVSYEVGYKSTQEWGCPFSIKCLFNDIKSAPSPSLPLPRTLPFPIDIKNMCYGN